MMSSKLASKLILVDIGGSTLHYEPIGLFLFKCYTEDSIAMWHLAIDLKWLIPKGHVVFFEFPLGSHFLTL